MKAMRITLCLFVALFTYPAEALCIFGVGDCSVITPAQIEASRLMIEEDITGFWADDHCFGIHSDSFPALGGVSNAFILSAAESQVPLMTILYFLRGGVAQSKEEIQSITKTTNGDTKILTRRVNRDENGKPREDFGKISEYSIVKDKNNERRLDGKLRCRRGRNLELKHLK